MFVEAEEGHACMPAGSRRRPGLEQEVMPLVEQGARSRVWQGWGLAQGHGPLREPSTAFLFLSLPLRDKVL